MKCGACEADAGAEPFCAVDWRALPRWARQELLCLRKLAERGSHRGIKEYGMACVAAVRLISAARPAPSTSAETP